MFENQPTTAGLPDINVKISVTSWPELNLELNENLTNLIWTFLISMIVLCLVSCTFCTILMVSYLKGIRMGYFTQRNCCNCQNERPREN